MEDAIRKQGPAYIQQQRFGKRWRCVWCVLYRETSCSIGRLEYFDCKEGGATVLDRSDKALKKQQDSKKVIRLSDCIHVAVVSAEGRPRETGSFLVETTDKLYVFAVDTHQLDDWTHTLCETAFPMKRGSPQTGGRNDEEGMEDNSLYSSRETLRDFRVCVRRTEAAERCGLAGVCVLRTDVEGLYLLDPDSHRLRYRWPYQFLRRFGRDKTSFSFEAGRRCESGEGSFEFDTRQGSALFQALDIAIRAHSEAQPRRPGSGAEPGSPESSRHRPLHVPQQPDQGAYNAYSTVDELGVQTRDKGEQKKLTLPLSLLVPPPDKVLTGVKSLTLECRETAIPRKSPVKSILSCPLLFNGPDPVLVSPSSAGPYPPALGPDPAQTYAQVSKGVATLSENREPPREKRREGKSASLCPPALLPQEPAYSLPFDHLPGRITAEEELRERVGCMDPLYDSIDESQIKRATRAAASSYSAAEHIYNQPEGYGVAEPVAPPPPPHSTYDELEEMRGQAWRTMGRDIEHELPYHAAADNYAVPKLCRAALAHRGGEWREEEHAEGEVDLYNNMTDRSGVENS